MSEDQIGDVGAECSTVTEIITVQEPIIHLTENGVEGFEVLCRLCANRSDHLIPIYSEEGISNSLAEKMNMYLPVKVAKTDFLPLQCCFQCATTVLTWHELMVACVEADRRLRVIQTEVEKQLAEQNAELEAEAEAEAGPSEMETKNEDFVEDNRLIISNDASLNPFRQENIEQHYKSEHNINTLPPIKKRSGHFQKTKHSNNENVKVETTHGEFRTTDGEWIKTELILESDDVNPFIVNCELSENQDLKSDHSEPSDFDELDPDYDPETDSDFKMQDCPSCGKICRTLIEFKQHIKICQTSEENEIMKIETLDDSTDEYLEVKPKFKREYRCDYCPTVAPRKEDLRKHVEEEHPAHYDSFSEKRQRRRSKIDQDAVNAAKVVVDSRTYYHCNECGKNLHSPYTYIWHNRIHTGERPFVCDLCGKQFRVSQGLVRHLRETHAGIKNFPCDLCGRMFATRRNVEEHRRIHTNERPYICDLCGKAFKQKASLFVHNRSHTDSFPFKCSYCNQGFRTRPPLLVHVTRHTGEKPYACDICGRCFRIKYELKRHRLIHSDDKPFSCTECGLSFRQKRYLRNHNKINHSRVSP